MTKIKETNKVLTDLGGYYCSYYGHLQRLFYDKKKKGIFMTHNTYKSGRSNLTLCLLHDYVIEMRLRYGIKEAESRFKELVTDAFRIKVTKIYYSEELLYKRERKE